MVTPSGAAILPGGIDEKSPIHYWHCLLLPMELCLVALPLVARKMEGESVGFILSQVTRQLAYWTWRRSIRKTPDLIFLHL